MNINKSKKRVVECNLRKSVGVERIRLVSKAIQVDEFCYLGSKITSVGRSSGDIKYRMEMKRKAFLKKRNLTSSIN